MNYKFIYGDIMALFGIFKRKTIIEMASPMPTPGILEASFLAGLGTSAFITVAPLVSSCLGGYFACQTSGCAISTSMAGGFSGGASASAVTIGAGTVIYKARYKSWLKKNSGKYIVNQFGKLEMVPLAFIATGTLTINPMTMIILTNSYCFLKGYIDKKQEIKKHVEDV